MYELLLLYYDNMQMLLNLGWKDSLFVNANKKKKSCIILYLMHLHTTMWWRVQNVYI